MKGVVLLQRNEKRGDNMSGKFPTTRIGDLELPRLVIGCNWVSGWSHRTPAKDNMILATHNNPESVSNIF